MDIRGFLKALNNSLWNVAPKVITEVFEQLIGSNGISPGEYYFGKVIVTSATTLKLYNDTVVVLAANESLEDVAFDEWETSGIIWFTGYHIV